MRSSVIAAMIAAAMTSGRRAAPAGGIVMSGAVVTAALFANLGGGVNVGNGSTYSAVAIPAPTRRLWGGQSEACPPQVPIGGHGAKTPSHPTISSPCRGCDPASWPSPELNATLAVLLHELIQQNHGRNRILTIFRAFPRHQLAPGAAGLRRHLVRLCGQPFPQPCARQHLGRCHGDRGLLPHAVLAVPAGCDHVLHGGAHAYGARHLCTVSAPAVPLADGRAAAARAGLEHPRAGHGARDRRAARPDAVRAPKALSAGTLSVLRRVEPYLDHDDPACHRLGARLHRHLFLASPQTVLHARGALSARGGRADPDAVAVGCLPGWPQRRGRGRRRGMADA